MRGKGLGSALMQWLIGTARAEGLRLLEGRVLAENTGMLALCRELGFTVAPAAGAADQMHVSLAL